MEKGGKRKILTIGAKLEIAKELENGEKISVLARRHSMNESSIRKIKLNADKIKSSVACSTPLAAKTTKKLRNLVMEKTEKLLSFWIEDQNQKRMGLSSGIIRNKALSIFNHLRKEEPGSSNLGELQFNASKGWFERFKQRQNLHNIKLTGEAASADTVAASLYPKILKDVIESGGYLPSQVFNADETDLFWKRMPSRTFISKEEKTAPGFKVAKDRLTLLLCGNAAGDCKNKPLLLHTSENPRAFKRILKTSLPVHWKSNKKAWMTAKIFEDWFLNCFCVEAESYCKNKNIAFKILLIIDNAPSHPAHLADLHPNVKVIFLPPNTTSLIQPMDQGDIAAFKLYYLRKTFLQLVEANDGPDSLSIREYWRQYNILAAVKNIKFAWDEVKNSTMNAVWKNIWPACCIREAVVEIPEVMEIVKIGKIIGGYGFENLESKDITDVLECDEGDLTVEEILAQVGDDNIDETEISEENVEIIEKKRFTSKTLAEFLKLGSQLGQEALDMDPDLERALKFRRNLTAALAPYEEVYMRKQRVGKKSLLTKFFTKPSETETISSSSEESSDEEMKY